MDSLYSNFERKPNEKLLNRKNRSDKEFYAELDKVSLTTEKFGT
jgi:hypothetical protein